MWTRFIHRICGKGPLTLKTISAGMWKQLIAPPDLLENLDVRSSRGLNGICGNKLYHNRWKNWHSLIKIRRGVEKLSHQFFL